MVFMGDLESLRMSVREFEICNRETKNEKEKRRKGEVRREEVIWTVE